MTYTHEGQDYEVIATGKDFELQGLHNVLTIVGGYDKLFLQCERSLKAELREADHINADYDFKSDLADMVDSNTLEFVKENISRAVVTEHNLN